MTIFVFDIETIPDIEFGRQMLGQSSESALSEKEIANALCVRAREKTGNDFLRHHWQQVVAISCVLRHQNEVRVWSLGEESSSEAELIQRFFAGLDKYLPTLVSWNGTGFDLPVLHYRALKHGIAAPSYWDMGENRSEFKWNNYINRYHSRHIDLMDVLSQYQGKAAAPLDEIAMLLGLPGKMGMSGDKVWDAFCNGEIKKIRNYCETDVLNTYLIFVRFQLMRGQLGIDKYEEEVLKVRGMLEKSEKEHLREFLRAWG